MKILKFPLFADKLNSIEESNLHYIIKGRVHDNFDVVHLIDLIPINETTDKIRDSNSNYIGFITIKKNGIENQSETSLCPCKQLTNTGSSLLIKELISVPHIHLEIERNQLKNPTICNFVDPSTENEDTSIEEIDFSRLFVRINQDETPVKVLTKKKIAVIGLGSGGALAVLYLAKSGVKDFIFIDIDRLEIHNIIRHICDLVNLGRYKTFAVKDYIGNRIPDVRIDCINRNFEINSKSDFDYFQTLFKDTDLILAVTGDHNVNFALNDFVHSISTPIPIIFAGATDAVTSGLIFKVNPSKEDLCYHCVYSSPSDDFSTEQQFVPSPKSLEPKINYDRTLQEQLSQPGLGLDIDNITIFLTKICLSTLLEDQQHGLYNFEHNFYIWYNRDIIKDDNTTQIEGLELYYYETLEKDPKCPFHGVNDKK